MDADDRRAASPWKPLTDPHDVTPLTQLMRWAAAIQMHMGTLMEQTSGNELRWQPIDMKHFGKLSEELGELQAAVARCLIQGIMECEPVTSKPNKQWLEEEIADVEAGAALIMGRYNIKEFEYVRQAIADLVFCAEAVTAHFNLNRKVMGFRQIRKEEMLREWHGMLT